MKGSDGMSAQRTRHRTTLIHDHTGCNRNMPCDFLPCKASDRLICKPLALSACKHKTHILEQEQD